MKLWAIINAVVAFCYGIIFLVKLVKKEELRNNDIETDKFDTMLIFNSLLLSAIILSYFLGNKVNV